MAAEDHRPRCIACLERQQDAVESGLWCSERQHFLCTSSECLLHYAENDETLLHSVPASSAKGSSHPKRPLLAAGAAGAFQEAFPQGRVPCCGSTGVPHSCWYDIDVFLGALHYSRWAAEEEESPAAGGHGTSATLHDRVAGAVDKFVTRMAPIRETPAGDPGVEEEEEVLFPRPVREGTFSTTGTMGHGGEVEGATSSSSKEAPGGAVATDQKEENAALASKQHTLVDNVNSADQRKQFEDGLLNALNLRCPNTDCRKLQDVQPSGCANVQCRWCATRYCAACFTAPPGGFPDKNAVYDHLRTHKFPSRNHYYPTKAEYEVARAAARKKQVREWLEKAEETSDADGIPVGKNNDVLEEMKSRAQIILAWGPGQEVVRFWEDVNRAAGFDVRDVWMNCVGEVAEEPPFARQNSPRVPTSGILKWLYDRARGSPLNGVARRVNLNPRPAGAGGDHEDKGGPENERAGPDNVDRDNVQDVQPLYPLDDVVQDEDDLDDDVVQDDLDDDVVQDDLFDDGVQEPPRMNVADGVAPNPWQNVVVDEIDRRQRARPRADIDVAAQQAAAIDPAAIDHDERDRRYRAAQERVRRALGDHIDANDPAAIHADERRRRDRELQDRIWGNNDVHEERGDHFHLHLQRAHLHLRAAEHRRHLQARLDLEADVPGIHFRGPVRAFPFVHNLPLPRRPAFAPAFPPPARPPVVAAAAHHDHPAAPEADDGLLAGGHDLIEDQPYEADVLLAPREVKRLRDENTRLRNLHAPTLRDLRTHEATIRDLRTKIDELQKDNDKWKASAKLQQETAAYKVMDGGCKELDIVDEGTPLLSSSTEFLNTPFSLLDKQLLNELLFSSP